MATMLAPLCFFIHGHCRTLPSSELPSARYVRDILLVRKHEPNPERVPTRFLEEIGNFVLTKFRRFHDLIFRIQTESGTGVSSRSLHCPLQAANYKTKAGRRRTSNPPISMKTNSRSNAPSRPHVFCVFLYVAIAAMALWSQSATVLGQIYVTNAFANTIGKYGLDGSVVSDSLVTGLDFPFDIAVWGDDIYVANLSSGVVGKYTTDGTTLDASLISGFPGLTALTVADGFLYVVDAVNGTVGKYNLDGTVVDAGLVMGLGSTPEGIAISGTDLFL